MIPTVYREKLARALHEAYASNQKQWLSDNKISVGDWVHIVDSAQDHALGWNNTWNPAMDAFVGKQGQVQNIYSHAFGVRVKVDGLGEYNFPFFILKPVAKSETVKLNNDYTAEVHADKVVVGCQTIPWEKIEDIVAAHKKLTNR